MGKYRIERLLGEGTFAQVYLATHVQLNALRAIKVLRRDAPGVGSTEYDDCRERFRLEAQLAAQTDSPHVVWVSDFEETEDLLALVMGYAAGGSLQAWLERARQECRPLPVDECVHIARDIAQGLAAIHPLDAVHRDLKPSNVLFDEQGRAKMADLRLAQMPGGPSLRSVMSQVVEIQRSKRGADYPQDILEQAEDIWQNPRQHIKPAPLSAFPLPVSHCAGGRTGTPAAARKA